MTLFVFCTGSGRVTFNNQRSYLKAVCAAFVEIKTPKFTKKVKTCLLHVVSTAAEVFQQLYAAFGKVSIFKTCLL